VRIGRGELATEVQPLRVPVHGRDHVQVCLGEDPKVCLLIVIGVPEDGCKKLLAREDGYRESTESWAGVFRDLKRRGLNEPKLVVGDGALGTWAAHRDVFPGAGEQRW
jgi:putative transposase